MDIKELFNTEFIIGVKEDVEAEIMRMDIREMKAGMKLNLLIATKIFNWAIWEETRGDYKYVLFQKPNEYEPYRRQQDWEKIRDRYKQITISQVDEMKHIICGLKNYSTDLSAAWEVVGKMKTRVDAAFGYYLAECIGLTTGMDTWAKENMPDSYSLAGWAADLLICELMEKLSPEKICIAALLAMEDKA